jgi:hypothetical protein
MKTLKHEFVIFQVEPVRPPQRQSIEHQGRQRGGAYGKEPKRYGQRRKQYAFAVRRLVEQLLDEQTQDRENDDA